MATFDQNLRAIKTAVYGGEVRQAIAEALEQCHGGSGQSDSGSTTTEPGFSFSTTGVASTSSSTLITIRMAVHFPSNTVPTLAVVGTKITNAVFHYGAQEENILSPTGDYCMTYTPNTYENVSEISVQVSSSSSGSAITFIAAYGSEATKLEATLAS